jgi:hypothetical protein
MANAVPRVDSIRNRIVQARDLLETRDFLLDLLKMPENRLFPIFGVTRWAPSEVHGLKDQIFFIIVTELVQSGWNCNMASFGDGRRDSFLMEAASRGLSGTVSRLLEMGADADCNSHGYGSSTPLMCARDAEIMKKLLYYGANPLAVNASGQTDFTYKLLRGFTAGALFYLDNTERIPFQSLLDNYKDCIVAGGSLPYESMYPLCLVPVVPAGVPYENVIDSALLDGMLREQFLPFTSRALTYPLEDDQTVWRYVKLRMKEHKTVSPTLAVACMACMVKSPDCRKDDDFAFLESYVEKSIPREYSPRAAVSKAVFVYTLFSLSNLPARQILRWLHLLDRLTRKFAIWMEILGEPPFRISNSLLPSDRRGSNILQELMAIQTLLAMRVNVTDAFGEFDIPEYLRSVPGRGAGEIG